MMTTYVDLDALARGLRLPEPQLDGSVAALVTCLEEVFQDFNGLSTVLLLELLSDLGYRLVASGPVAPLFEEAVLRDALGLEKVGPAWRREEA